MQFKDDTSFEFFWNSAKDIEFDKEWANNTGYFNWFSVTEMVKFTDDHNRKIIAIPINKTEMIFIFQRYTKKNIKVINIERRRDYDH